MAQHLWASGEHDRIPERICKRLRQDWQHLTFTARWTFTSLLPGKLRTTLQARLSFFVQTQSCNNQFVISSCTESFVSAANVKGNKQFDGQHIRARGYRKKQ